MKNNFIESYKELKEEAIKELIEDFEKKGEKKNVEKLKKLLAEAQEIKK